MNTITETSYSAALEIDAVGIVLTVMRDVPSGISGPLTSHLLQPVSNQMNHVFMEAERVLLDAGYIMSGEWTFHINGIFTDLIKTRD